jgi:hypothetical protein
MTVAVDLACKQAMQGGRIKHDLTIGGDSQKLSNQHQIFLEYRRRTGLKGIGVAHFMGTLAQADAAGLIRYKTRGGGRKGERAGYYPTDNWAPIKGVYESNSDMMNFLI